MVLHQLTGDERWLQDPYRPTRTRGQDDHDTGGLDPAVQQEIRDAAGVALAAWYQGAPAAVPAPDVEHLQRMMQVCVAEDVPVEYARMGRVVMGFEDPADDAEAAAPAGTSSGPRDPGTVSAIIVGAGVSGIVAAKEFLDRGIPFTILDKNAGFGGTWFENVYPGCGVDTPSYLYSFTFAPRSWNRYFARRPEVAEYMSSVAEGLGLRSRTVLGVEVVGAEFDGASDTWTVTGRAVDGTETQYQATILVASTGLFSPPKVPQLPGAAEFTGPAFHSARWPEGLDLAGKRVAVIGSGASAMQVVPAISTGTAEVTVFQRTPQWIIPMEKYFDDVDAEVHRLMEQVPFYHVWYRFRLVWMWNDKIHATLRMDPQWQGSPAAANKVNDRTRQMMTGYIEQQLAGRPDLLAKSVPEYPPFAKRILIDNGWYRSLLRPNVTLVAESVAGLDADGVVTSTGDHHPADVVVYATGFETDRYLHPIRVLGRGGAVLSEVWNGTDPRAYLGMTVPGFPNLFLMYGPNTNPPGGSFIYIAECQGHYIGTMASMMLRDGISAVECKPERYETYTEQVDVAAAGLLWSHPRVASYYKNAFGRVVTNSPWRVVDYWHMTRHPDLADFDCSTAGAPANRPAAG
ncbi:SidA/IucD/PvdA family monooxygenase [Nakamurella sp. YIM 132087]|uniref:SidA/IucD/PvdA family monooxygenase n=2 Tax=Nakamurella alba TaxID=2665158 RepID=A0A7K1FIV5_9ACTN|nr:SidA/IucD/PvdA family monooxygenase [Nakamurella alba]